ncbi:microtubule-associated protein 2-like isoform X2 [Asterias rubens]|uniref:microtubule-associated protein 2-like isoform X2 n=1 Tax=Asterias rubens TaxID=7604 RepID=UPI001455D506|nr:microtubule-associated protein 2-like isoform X2 [Asterias rubens]
MADAVFLPNDNHVSSFEMPTHDVNGAGNEQELIQNGGMVSNGHSYTVDDVKRVVNSGLSLDRMVIESQGEPDAAPCEAFNPDSIHKEPQAAAKRSPSPQIPPPSPRSEQEASPRQSPSPSPGKGTPTKIPSLRQRPRSVGSYDDVVRRPQSPRKQSPRPNSCVLKSTSPRINSRQENYIPGGGNVKIATVKSDMSGVKSRTVSHTGHKPGGGNVKIFDKKVDYSHVKARSDIGSGKATSPSPRKSASSEPTSPRAKTMSTPIPNTKNVQSKIGSKDNLKHTPGGGKVKIQTEKVDFTTVQSRCGSLNNTKHKPGGGNVKIESKKLDFSKTSSKVGSKDNLKHQPQGGNKKIINEKIEFKAESKIGSKDNIKHQAGGGKVKILNEKVDFTAKAASKVGSKDNIEHKPGGGNVQIMDEKLVFKDTASPRTDTGVKEPRSPGGSLSRSSRGSRSSVGSQEGKTE